MLDVRHLEVSYGATQVLRDVSFSVAEGSIVALLGGNGSGKTTTLNVLSGLVAPQGGTVTLDGDELTWGTDWHLLDEHTLELLGDACQAVMAGGEHTVEAYFTCEAVVD